MTWKTVALGEIIELQNGFAFKSSEYAENGYFLMRITNVQQGFIQNNNPKYVSIPESSKLKQFILNEGDILLSLTGDVGRVGVLNESNLPAALNQRVARVLIKSARDVNKNYIFNLLNSEMIRNQIESLGHGAAQLNVSTKDILSIKVQLPSLPIQQKIVAKLDAIFAEIEKATAAAEANVKNTEALFQSYLTQVFEHGGEGWQRMEMGRISKVINGYAFKSTDFNSDSGVKCLKITNVGIREFVGDTNEYLPNSFAKNHSNFLVKEGSIVIPLTRTIIGGGLKVAIVPAEFHNSLLNQRVASIEVMPEIIDSELIYYYLSSSIVTNYVLSHVNTLMQPNLSIKDLLSMPVPIPPKKLQSKLKNTISSTIYSIFQIKYLNIKRASECNFLKQSILKQAFNGELVKE